MTADQINALLTALTMLGGVTAFAIGLVQYNKAEVWRRREFLANQMKEFYADPAIRNALLMVDWGGRPINLDLVPELSRANWPYIRRVDQTSALHPHTVAHLRPPKTLPDGTVTNRDQAATFTPNEARIRDTYDTLLDRLEVFESFVSAHLIKSDELHPYLKYWIDDIASADAQAEDLDWTLALFAYIHCYGFQGVARLFGHFGYDITPDGATWNAIEQKVKDGDLIKRLRLACQSQ